MTDDETRVLPELATRTRQTVLCRACGTEAQADIHVARLGPYDAEWVRPPTGWWMLTRASEPLLRCPACLPAPGGSS